MIISHNLTASNTIRNYNSTTNQMQNSLKKISSGYRINTASDDAAGLSISEKMRAQIRGLERASQNGQEGISLIQTADGALEQVQSLLQRGRELSVKAANDVNTAEDREAIEVEIQNINDEIDSIGSRTEFNNQKLFKNSNSASSVRPFMAAGSSNTVSNNTGNNINNATVTYAMQDFTNIINSTSGKGYTQAGLEKFADYIGDTLLPDILGNISNALPNSSSTPTLSNMQLGLEFYNASDGTVAAVACNGLNYSLRVNLAGYSESNGEVKFDKDYLTMVLSHEMMHAVMFDTVTSGMFGMSTGVYFPDWFVEGTAQCIGGGQAWVGGMPTDKTQLENWLNNLKTGSAYAQGYVATMYLGYVAGGGGEVDSKIIASGLDNILTDVSNGYSLSESIYINTKGKYVSFEDFEKNYGKDAVDFALELKSIIDKGGSGSIAVTGGLSASMSSILNDGISGNYFTLDKNTASHRNDIYAAGKDPFSGGETNGTNGFDRDGKKNPNASSSWTGVGITPNNWDLKAGNWGNGLGFKIQIGANSGQIIEINKFGLSMNDLGLKGVSVTSREAASRSIDNYDKAIMKVSNMRAKYGALQNRLEFAISNVENTSENLTASESRIRDADLAKEMIKYSKNNILQQAAQSLLSKSLEQPRNVLQLLQ